MSDELTSLVIFVLAQVHDDLFRPCVEHVEELSVLGVQAPTREVVDAPQSVNQFPFFFKWETTYFREYSARVCFLALIFTKLFFEFPPKATQLGIRLKYICRATQILYLSPLHLTTHIVYVILLMPALLFHIFAPAMNSRVDGRPAELIGEGGRRPPFFLSLSSRYISPIGAIDPSSLFNTHVNSTRLHRGLVRYVCWNTPGGITHEGNAMRTEWQEHVLRDELMVERASWYVTTRNWWHNSRAEGVKLLLGRGKSQIPVVREHFQRIRALGEGILLAGHQQSRVMLWSRSSQSIHPCWWQHFFLITAPNDYCRTLTLKWNDEDQEDGQQGNKPRRRILHGWCPLLVNGEEHWNGALWTRDWRGRGREPAAFDFATLAVERDFALAGPSSSSCFDVEQ